MAIREHVDHLPRIQLPPTHSLNWCGTLHRRVLIRSYYDKIQQMMANIRIIERAFNSRILLRIISSLPTLGLILWVEGVALEGLGVWEL